MKTLALFLSLQKKFKVMAKKKKGDDLVAEDVVHAGEPQEIQPENLDSEGQPTDEGQARIGAKVIIALNDKYGVNGEITYPENEYGQFEVKIPVFNLRRTASVHRSRIQLGQLEGERNRIRIAPAALKRLALPI